MARTAFLLVVFLVFFVVGFALFVASLQTLPTLQKAQDWPRANGEILKSTLTEYYYDDDDNLRLSVEYRYTVEGLEYRGDRLHFGMGKGNEEHVRQQAKQYALGASVQVIYDPDAPYFSALEASFYGAIVGIGLGLFFTDIPHPL